MMFATTRIQQFEISLEHSNQLEAGHVGAICLSKLQEGLGWSLDPVTTLSVSIFFQ